MIELILKKKYFYPDEYHKTVYSIDFNSLQSKGIKNILIDLDNTLIPYDKSYGDQLVKDFINKIKSLGMRIIIISNNKENRVKKFSEDVKCDYIFSAKKPLKWGFKKALKRLDNPNPSSVALIGDQFMTDVLGGKRMGFYVVVVDAIKRKTEKWYTKLNRKFENRILKRLEKTDPDFYHTLKLKEKK